MAADNSKETGHYSVDLESVVEKVEMYTMFIYKYLHTKTLVASTTALGSNH